VQKHQLFMYEIKVQYFSILQARCTQAATGQTAKQPARQSLHLDAYLVGTGLVPQVCIVAACSAQEIMDADNNTLDDIVVLTARD
jgi:hypothetical protein